MTDHPPDDAPAPVFNIPLVVAIASLALIGVHLARLGMSRTDNLWLLREFAYVPGRLIEAVYPHAMNETLHGKGIADLQRFDLARIFLGGGLKPWTAVTYAVLHANVAHLALNLVWFVAFGTPVARRFGMVRFVLFLIVTSITSAAAQTLAQPYGVEPVIGASGAVSGVVAAALRFVFQPGGRLLNAGKSAGEERRSPHVAALPLTALWRDRQVMGFVVIWFAMNLVFGIFAQPLGITDGPIAWQAHIGGFIAGLILFALFDPRAPAAYRDGSG